MTTAPFTDALNFDGVYSATAVAARRSGCARAVGDRVPVISSLLVPHPAGRGQS